MVTGKGFSNCASSAAAAGACGAPAANDITTTRVCRNPIMSSILDAPPTNRFHAKLDERQNTRCLSRHRCRDLGDDGRTTRTIEPFRERIRDRMHKAGPNRRGNAQTSKHESPTDALAMRAWIDPHVLELPILTVIL